MAPEGTKIVWFDDLGIDRPGAALRPGRRGRHDLVRREDGLRREPGQAAGEQAARDDGVLRTDRAAWRFRAAPVDQYLALPQLSKTARSPRSTRNTPASTWCRCPPSSFVVWTRRRACAASKTRRSDAPKRQWERRGMHYAFHFNVVWDHWRELARRARGSPSSFRRWRWCSASPSPSSAPMHKAAGPGPLRWADRRLYRADQEHAVPGADLHLLLLAAGARASRLGANEAALAAMVVNFGAYGTEILRAGIEAIPQGQIEAARALGLTRLQTFRHVVLFPALKTVYPALASQFILLMLALQRRLGDIGGRAHRDDQFAAIDDVPPLRVLLRRDRRLSRHGPGHSGLCSAASTGCDSFARQGA